MTTLANLKLVSATKPNKVSTTVQRRLKLAGRLDEQLAIAKAALTGDSYQPTKTRSYIDNETGLRKQTLVPKRVKPWWFTSEDGKLCLSVRYGARILYLAKGKTAVEVAENAQLVPTLEAIKSAVMAGELDGQIESASEDLKSGFKG